MKPAKIICILVALVATHPAWAERYLIEINESANLTNEIKRHDISIIRPLESVPNSLVTEMSPDTAEKLRQKYPDIKITLDTIMKISALETFRVDPIAPAAQTVPWGIKTIDANLAHAMNKGAGVKVCIVDTGIDKKHPDLKQNISGGRNFVADKGKVTRTAWDDENGHGTHVAGIIAARDNTIGVIGVAPLARLFIVRVLDKDGIGYLSDVADGVLSCVRSGSRVINMSLGAAADPKKDTPLKRAVDYAIKKGIIIVVAAGNEGQNISNTIPAGYKNTIAVSATDSDNKFPAWSNFGLSAGDAAAPGVTIYSTWPDNKYATLDGTSMAAPHVSGVVALSISSGTNRLSAVDLGAPVSKQGDGLINALLTIAK